MRSLLYCVPAPLNAALVANEKIAAKTECLGLIVRMLCLILHFELRDLGSRKLSFDLFLVWFAVSEADLLVESQLCGTVSPKGLFGVVSSFSTALRVPSGFSDWRFETTPDLTALKYVGFFVRKA
ncbi:hypothetical protein ACOQ0N_004075 [Vibrio parahaemolyticus]|uniref:hypothetical protein n=3 Tax=Vibrio parahaemolyticus TaxID=670 RepID=UPI00149519E8|nr:hypothetical protein [Vibrio parahaemolyticus]EHK5158133.1 hypothetical protein [Vibrio parahaemolyticus]EHZ7319030.1 hypothetical protein [Vibrio parahaemolyticus]EIA4668655.1 hypothetical protein [Vibrio parahaemolyticus]EIC2729009.1 hypothetical protein [Vibrio parahaemolyticus]EIM5979038.1 hypothetical protein [Vibrio parahaemolyticus]